MASWFEEALAVAVPTVLWGMAGGCAAAAVWWRRQYVRGLPAEEAW